MDGDADSALGVVSLVSQWSLEELTVRQESIASSTTSLREELIKVREEHGRRYHGFLDASRYARVCWITPRILMGFARICLANG